MKNVILVIKGFIMGIANIIPGVSGGTLALTLGIYEKFINAISHLMKNLKENLKFLIPIVIGMGLSILVGSNVVSAAFDKFPLPTTLFFMGLVLGGIPMIMNKIKESMKKDKKHKVKQNPKVNFGILALTFILVMILAFSEEIFGSGLGNVNLTNVNAGGYFILFLVGVVAAATMVIPGVSGSLVLMLLGYYLPVVNTIKDLTHFKNVGHNILICIPFGLGVLIGIVLIAKLIEWLLNKYKTKSYFGVLGFILASIIAIPVSVYHEVMFMPFNLIEGIIAIGLLIAGYFIGNKLGEK